MKINHLNPTTMAKHQYQIIREELVGEKVSQVVVFTSTTKREIESRFGLIMRVAKKGGHFVERRNPGWAVVNVRIPGDFGFFYTEEYFIRRVAI